MGSFFDLSTELKALIPADSIDFWARELGSTYAVSRVFARIEHLHLEAHDTLTIGLSTNRNFRGLRPGQHITVSVDVAGRRVSRCYSPSLSSRNSDKGRHSRNLSITLRRDAHGTLSNWFHREARIGDIIELSQAFGDLPEAADKAGEHLLLLAAGSGITAIAALAEDFARRRNQLNGALLYWERDEESFCFRDQLKDISRRHPQFTVHFISTGKATGEGRSRRISAELLSRYWTGKQPPTEVFACGGDGFVASAANLFENSATAFHAEAFSPPIHPATRSSDEGASPSEVAIELRRSGRTITAPTGQSLLQSLEAAGVKVAVGCRMGICNTCSCQQRLGSSRSMTNNIEQLGDTPIRLCISQPQSPLSLDL